MITKRGLRNIMKINLNHMTIEREIRLLDLETKEECTVIYDSDSESHSWSNDGRVLYYGTRLGDKNVIKIYDIEKDKSAILCEGDYPVISPDGTKIAFMKNDSLVIMDLNNKDKWIYDGNVYAYGFSPDSTKLVVEDYLSKLTFLKNLLYNERIFGHRVLVWDYKDNAKKVIVDSKEEDFSYVLHWVE